MIEYYLKMYYKDDTLGHGETHIRDVLDTMHYVLQHSKYNTLDIYLTTLAVCVHDTFCALYRKEHHTLAAAWVLTCDCPYVNHLTMEERSIVSGAVKEHRSSGNGKCSSLYSEVMYLADTGKPNIDKYMQRCWDYISKDKTSDKNKAKEVLRHMEHKFGKQGYGLNKLYREFFQKELAIFHTKLSQLTFMDVIKLCK